MEQSKELLIGCFEKYPKLQIQDVFKFIYQSSFGCEHMVASLEKATEYLKKEYDNGVSQGEIEVLDGDYCRVPLSYIDMGLNPETFGKLFYLSAKKEEKGQEKLIEKLKIARSLIVENKLPFDVGAFDKEVEKWEERGYPAVHHSEEFRNAYKPAYRLISKKYVPFLPLLAQIDKQLQSGNMKLAIEGGSASGKSTLSDIIESIYICTIIHMDDFFLQLHQRTPARLNEAGGNIDKERFLSEILNPLEKGEKINYRPFDCQTMSVKEGKEIIPQRLTVVEGAYSMHPYFKKYYDFSVFLDIAPEAQRQRILKRNGEAFAQRFFNEWIPMENKYFSAFDIKEKSDMIILVK